jgi:hypothetical protein
MVTNGANVNVLATERHPKYYIEGADLHVLVRPRLSISRGLNVEPSLTMTTYR